MANNLATIVALFPHNPLSDLGTSTSKPNYDGLRILQTQCNASLLAIHSNRGNGTSGLLALGLQAPDFLALTGTPFDPPDNPGADPDHDDMNGPQITESNRAHLSAQQEFATYHNTDRALRNMIVAACPLVYIRALHNTQLGLAT